MNKDVWKSAQMTLSVNIASFLFGVFYQLPFLTIRDGNPLRMALDFHGGIIVGNILIESFIVKLGAKNVKMLKIIARVGLVNLVAVWGSIFVLFRFF